MPAFVPVFYLDTLELAGSLRTRWGQFKTVAPGHRVLRIRGHAKGSEEADDRFAGYVAAQKWVEFSNLRGEITRRAEALLPPGIELGVVQIEMLEPGTTLDWNRETSAYFERWSRAILPVRTNPATLFVCGTEIASPGPGWLTIVSPRLPHTAINMGEHGLVWVSLDFRKKNVEKDH